MKDSGEKHADGLPVVYTNNLEKGDVVRVSQGFEGTIEDNKKGLLRSFKPSSGMDAGWARDMYAYDIASVRYPVSSGGFVWLKVTLTDEQRRRKAVIQGAGF